MQPLCCACCAQVLADRLVTLELLLRARPMLDGCYTGAPFFLLLRVR